MTHPHFSFFVSWILFAIVWFVCLNITIPSFKHLYRYLISYVHGDFLYYQLQDNDAWVRWKKPDIDYNHTHTSLFHFQKETLGEDFKPCVFAMEEGWASSFLMSVETQHTIG